MTNGLALECVYDTLVLVAKSSSKFVIKTPTWIENDFFVYNLISSANGKSTVISLYAVNVEQLNVGDEKSSLLLGL